MIFNSFTFGIFFAVVLGAYYALGRFHTLQKLLLLLASYLFYAAWNPPLVLLLLFSTAVDWAAAGWMTRTNSQRRRRWALYVSLCSNLGLLAAFKYGGFIADTFTSLSGLELQSPEWNIVVPVGISFYTFQTLSFSIDVYRGKLEPKQTSLLDFALFVSFFPQLVAGPIVRAVDFLPQLTVPRRATQRMLVWGLTLLSIGLFQKSVLADAMLAPVADAAFAAVQPSIMDAWVGAVAFSGQIFFDFAGYSTCAIGVALCFGYCLPDNFWFPYGASGFSEFWQRWHISLSSWLRDYLYISLGGNRGTPSKTLRNLLLTMILGGLWHGASWNFVVWGVLHGVFLVAERSLLRRSGLWNSGGWFSWVVTQICVLVAWIPFRCQTLGDTARFFSGFLGLAAGRTVTTSSNLALVLGVCGLLYAGQRLVRSRRLEDLMPQSPLGLGLTLGVLWVGVWLAQPADRAFIYFQF